MDEKRRSIRIVPPMEEQLLTVHGRRKNYFGRAIDESTGGIGIHLAEQAQLEVGESVLVHRLEGRRLRVGTVRHVANPSEQGTQLGVEWGPS